MRFETMSPLRYLFYIFIHPVTGFEELKYNKKGSLVLANCIMPVSYTHLSLLHGGLWHRMRRSGDCYLLVAPYLLFFTVFTVVPVLVAMGFSFTQFNMLETPSFIGLKNYAHMFFLSLIHI